MLVVKVLLFVVAGAETGLFLTHALVAPFPASFWFVMALANPPAAWAFYRLIKWAARNEGARYALMGFRSHLDALQSSADHSPSTHSTTMGHSVKYR